jgi:hypothetical protein
LIPDGWWFGGIEDLSAASLRLDLVCVYSGAEASTRIADCAATEDYEFCTAYWGEHSWPVNTTERERVVPVDPGVVRVVDSTQGCSVADIDQYERDELSWFISYAAALSTSNTCVRVDDADRRSDSRPLSARCELSSSPATTAGGSEHVRELSHNPCGSPVPIGVRWCRVQQDGG